MAKLKNKLQWYKQQLTKSGCSCQGGWLKMTNRYAVKSGLFPPVQNKRDARQALIAVFGHPPADIQFRKQYTPKPVGKPPLRYINPNTDAFLESYEWRRVRMEVLKRDGARCQCCGATPQDGLRMHVDHIKPRKLFPTLALDVNNLQVLCEICNHGKGNWDTTDWRSETTMDEELHRQHLRDIMGEE